MLFEKGKILDENFNILEEGYLFVKGDSILYVGDSDPRNMKEFSGENFGEVINCKDKLLMPGFVNNHAHMPMTLLRGYAENMTLQDWLFKKVFPFEDKLNKDAVYYGSLLSMAESLRFGITSTTDMYYFMDEIAQAVIDSGAKANISRAISHFDDSELMTSFRAFEMIDAYEKYNGAHNDRIRVDMSLHSEYTTTPKAVRDLAEYTSKIGANMHVHISETKREVEECKERHGGLTPVQYLYENGLFSTQTTGAHCVWLEDADYKILRENNVFVATNPTSNMKLASGICNVGRIIDEGIKLTVGTDGVASNNNLNFLEELKLMNIGYKVAFDNPVGISAEDTLRAATLNGALSQGRKDTGLIKAGYKADLILIDLNKPYMKPVHNILNNLIYSSCGTDVELTMVNGKVLYRNGVYTTIDVDDVYEKVGKLTEEILSKI